MIKVLHLTAHLGGGVGKALSGLAVESAAVCPEISHVFVCFEQQEKPQFLERIIECGCEVFVSPQTSELTRLVEAADIVQLEFWNHPLILQALCSQSLPAMRLLVWCHISGLYNPVIPTKLFSASELFLFTSSCSYESAQVAKLPPDVRCRLGVVSSCGGFNDLPWPSESGEALKLGYIGSLNFAKMHPRYVDFLAAVEKPDLTVRLIGDLTNRDILEKHSARVGREGMLEFRGYNTDIAAELKAINVLAYLLNPEHYGTTENALLEAMAMGVVPIVLDNPAERQIVEDHRTGLVVSTPKEFAEAVTWLTNNLSERQCMGRHAAEAVRSKFAVSKMLTSYNKHYPELMSARKRDISFTDVFGPEPADWFLSCQGKKEFFPFSGTAKLDPDSFSTHAIFEKTKGSVFHYQKYFPNDLRLCEWVNALKSQMPS